MSFDFIAISQRAQIAMGVALIVFFLAYIVFRMEHKRKKH